MHRVLGFALLMAAASMPAHADNLLGVAPLRLILTDAKTSDLITLTNRSEGPHTYKLVTEDQVMNAEGGIVQKDDFPYSAKRMLRFMPRTIKLEGGQRQNVRVMAIMPDGLANGDYHTHLIFQEVNEEKPAGVSSTEGLKIAMGTLYNIGIPVVLQHGKIESSLKLNAAEIGTKQDKPAVTIVVDRNGNGEAAGTIQVIDKATQANVVQPDTVHIYHEADRVTLNLPVSPKVDIASLKGKPLEVRLLNDGKVLATLDVKGTF